jgi:hypothetical protein
MPMYTEASVKPTAEELTAISARGRLLADYDTASWLATDALTATHPKSEPAAHYIAHKSHAGWVVDFGSLDATRGKFMVAYEATQTGSSYRFEVKSFNPAREDTGWNLSAAEGIETANGDFGNTDRPYNAAVLPAENGTLYVYLYPAQIENGVYPLGADVRYRITQDGRKVVEKRQLHKSIIESAPVHPGEEVAGGYHVHVLSELPEDTDVFFVLVRKPRVPEVIIAGHFTYTIDVHGVITLADRPQ